MGALRTRRPLALLAAGAVAVPAACTSAWLIAGTAAGLGGRVVLLCAAFGGFAVLFLPPVRKALGVRHLAVAGLVAAVVAVAVPPRDSGDLWSYVMYGRIVSVHHASPFTHIPGEYPHDPLLPRVSIGWRATPSVYGPAFVAVSAAGTAAAGSSPLANRVFFQALEAAAVAAAALILWRHARDPAAVAFVVLNPAVIIAVNGGHNDVLAGVAVLAGVLLATRGRPAWAGVALAVGVLVKALVLLPLGALAVWAWYRRSKREAAAVAGTGAAVVVAGYLVAGGRAALDPLLRMDGRGGSRASLWRAPTEWLANHFVSSGHARPLASVLATRDIAHLSLLIAAVLVAAVLALQARRGSAPEAMAGCAVLVFLLLGSYVLPWYSACALIVLAAAWRSAVAVIACLQAALLAAAYMAPTGGTTPAAHMFFDYYGVVLPAVLAGALLLLLVLVARSKAAGAGASGAVPAGS